MPKKGSLIRVVDSALEQDNRESDGWLWIVTRVDTEEKSMLKGDVYARALATGNEHYWYGNEYVAAD